MLHIAAGFLPEVIFRWPGLLAALSWRLAMLLGRRSVRLCSTSAAAPPSKSNSTPLLNIVLHEPQIPGNTGTAARPYEAICTKIVCGLRAIVFISFKSLYFYSYTKKSYKKTNCKELNTIFRYL